MTDVILGSVTALSVEHWLGFGVDRGVPVELIDIVGEGSGIDPVQM